VNAAKIEAPEDRTDGWFDDILAGRSDRIYRAFHIKGSFAPRTLWTPRADEALTAPVRHLIRHFDGKSGPVDGIPSGLLDPTELKPALGYINLVEPVEGGRDFRYRIFGTYITAVTGCDMTGRLLSELPDCRNVVDYALASYRAVLARRLPLLSQRMPIDAKGKSRWERVILPFVAPDNSVSRLLVGVVPVGVTGLPMRPKLFAGN
jgi:hypothetical protein